MQVRRSDGELVTVGDVCNTPGCPTLTERAYCGDCSREREAERGSSTARGYGAEWRRMRLYILARDPRCRMGCGRPSVEVDHITPRSRGGLDLPSNLRGLCKSCHSRKTAGDDGGFGQRTLGI